MKLMKSIGAGIFCSALLALAQGQDVTSTTTTTTTTNYHVFKVCDSDMDIYSSDNVSVGRIDSIVVEPEGRIYSMVVAPSAQLDVQGELVVVPYSGAHFANNRIQVNVARDVIVHAPTVSRTQVRTVVQPQFAERVNTYYRTASTTGGAARSSTTATTRDAATRDTTSRDTTTTRDGNLRPPAGTSRDATATRDADRPGDTTRLGNANNRTRENQPAGTAADRERNADRP